MAARAPFVLLLACSALAYPRRNHSDAASFLEVDSPASSFLELSARRHRSARKHSSVLIPFGSRAPDAAMAPLLEKLERDESKMDRLMAMVHDTERELSELERAIDASAIEGSEMERERRLSLLKMMRTLSDKATQIAKAWLAKLATSMKKMSPAVKFSKMMGFKEERLVDREGFADLKAHEDADIFTELREAMTAAQTEEASDTTPATKESWKVRMQKKAQDILRHKKEGAPHSRAERFLRFVCHLRGFEPDCFEDINAGVALEFSTGGEFSAFVGFSGESFAGACYAPYADGGGRWWWTSGFGAGVIGGFMAGPSLNFMGTLSVQFDVSGPFGPGNRWTADPTTEEASVMKRGWKYGMRPYYEYEMGIGAVLGVGVLNLGMEGGILFDNLGLLLRWIKPFYNSAFHGKKWAELQGLYFTCTAATGTPVAVGASLAVVKTYAKEINSAEEDPPEVATVKDEIQAALADESEKGVEDTGLTQAEQDEETAATEMVKEETTEEKAKKVVAEVSLMVEEKRREGEDPQTSAEDGVDVFSEFMTEHAELKLGGVVISAP